MDGNFEEMPAEIMEMLDVFMEFFESKNLSINTSMDILFTLLINVSTCTDNPDDVLRAFRKLIDEALYSPFYDQLMTDMRDDDN